MANLCEYSGQCFAAKYLSSLATVFLQNTNNNLWI
jgi:hypothetical protein